MRAQTLTLTILVTVALLVGAAVFGYRAGYDRAKSAQLSAVQKYQSRVASLLQDLEDERAKQKVVIREKIRTVKQAADPSGCADQPITPDILDQLR